MVLPGTGPTAIPNTMLTGIWAGFPTAVREIDLPTRPGQLQTPEQVFATQAEEYNLCDAESHVGLTSAHENDFNTDAKLKSQSSAAALGNLQ